MTLDEIYDEVLEIVCERGAEICGDIELFLTKEIEAIPGTKEEVISAVSAKASEWFRSAGDRPEWIQFADWPVRDGKPMVFLGQVAVPPSAGLFHDDAAAFVFIAPDGVTTTIIQVS
jgi:hypothetical protein